MAVLDATVLRAALHERAASRLDRIETFDEIDSTNSYLANKPPPGPGRGHLAYADHQTAGRGRQERRWQSEPGRSLCLSIAWRFESLPEHLPALTLAHGAAVVHALNRIGATGLKIKWPNDILLGNAKLGGILTETQFKGADDVVAVTGIGINLEPVEVDLSAGGWSGAISSLEAATEGGFERLHVAVAVIEAMTDAFDTYGLHGLDAFRERYETHDALVGREVEVDAGDGRLEGRVQGIDATGALLLDTGDTTERIVTGSIRRIPDSAAA